jgi:hypothetical protein
MRLVILFALSCSLVGTPAQAGFKGCYERVYDKTYLKKHKTQDVIKMRLQVGVGRGTDGPFEYLDRIDAGFRKKPVYRGGLVECREQGDQLMCGIEADGGQFTVTNRGAKSIRIDNAGFMRLGDDEDGIEIKATGEHRQFRLFQISTGPCP